MALLLSLNSSGGVFLYLHVVNVDVVRLLHQSLLDLLGLHIVDKLLSGLSGLLLGIHVLV